jgi:alpha-ribazole phosphatase/probable phosphoglycerate mutase
LDYYRGDTNLELYLIRHGEIQGVQKRQYNGHRDIPLSDRGRAQLSRLAAYLKDKVAFDAVCASDLSRSAESARIIAAPQSLRPTLLPAFRERNFGAWEGMTFDEIAAQNPDVFYAWARDPLHYSPVGGESTISVSDRVMPALAELRARHQGQKIALVAHGGVNRVILCELLGVPLQNIFRIEQDYGALNVIEFLKEMPLIKQLNFVVGDAI